VFRYYLMHVRLSVYITARPLEPFCKALLLLYIITNSATDISAIFNIKLNKNSV